MSAVFRPAAALNVDAVLEAPRCPDTLYRRSVRVRMGAVFQVPWKRTPWSSSIASVGQSTSRVGRRSTFRHGIVEVLNLSVLIVVPHLLASRFDALL